MKPLLGFISMHMTLNLYHNIITRAQFDWTSVEKVQRRVVTNSNRST